MKSPHFVYVLRCADGSYYTGYTTDLKRREQAHNDKVGAKYTKARLPVKIVYAEEWKTKQEAMSREAEIKSLTRRQKELLVKQKQS